MEPSGQFHTPAVLPPRNGPELQYPLNGKVGGQEPMLMFLPLFKKTQI